MVEHLFYKQNVGVRFSPGEPKKKGGKMQKGLEEVKKEIKDGKVEKEIFRHGGLTVVELRENGSCIAYGCSRLSFSDKGNKRIGIEIAEGRAMKSLCLKRRGKAKNIVHYYMG